MWSQRSRSIYLIGLILIFLKIQMKFFLYQESLLTRKLHRMKQETWEFKAYKKTLGSIQLALSTSTVFNITKVTTTTRVLKVLRVRYVQEAIDGK